MLATFAVNDLGDTNDANPGDGVAEDAAGNTTLRAAIEEANALAGADDINFSVAGVVNLSLGELSVSSDLSVDGANSVTVDAGGTSRVMNVNSGTVTLSNLTLNNGSATQGGGVISAGDLTLSGATVSNSTAMQFGGGVFSSGTLALTNSSVVTGNSVGTTNTAFGGGVVSYQGTLTIDNSTVSNNSSSQYGGGIFGLQGSVEITNNSMIADNAISNSVGAYASGGGISVANGMYVPNNAGVAPFSLTISDSTVSGNSLYGTNFPYGAGVYSFGYGTVSIANTNITGNMNTGGGGARGAAGFNWPAGALGPGTLTVNITDSVIENNISYEESGGFGLRATSLDNPVVMNISGSSLSNNTAYGAGGAGFLWSAGADPNSAIVNIQDSTVSGNYSAQTGGGLEFNNANVTISDSTIDGNTTLLNGGGVYLGGSALDDYGYTPPRVVFERTTISNNYANVEGGGSYAYDFDVVFDNSTISGNTASVYGGGSYHRVYDIYAASPYETTTEFNSSTITNNYSAIGGGAYATTYTTLRATNSIFAGNTGGTGPDVRATQTPDFAYSLVGDGTDSTLAPGNPDANGNIIGDAATPIDPMLGALADNGGPTLTHMPMAGSPVLDAGDPTVLGGLDQRSYTRVEDDDAVPGARIDMGSVERSGTPVVPVSCDFDGDLDCDGDDINMLTAETAAGTNNPAFDLNNDMLVDAADIG
ncbi:MAG: choice-of-anchor Q domain-containing protein, partial [Planctomycetota bacterium]